MSVLMQRAMEDLKGRTVALGAIVERSLKDAIDALRDWDAEKAKRVVEGDRIIDEKEVEIEEECLKILALHQPVAFDLRFVAAIIKLTNDLERIGDLAGDMAGRVVSLAHGEQMSLPDSIAAMEGPVQDMLRRSLDALVNLDADLARRVCEADDEVDALHRTAFQQVSATIREDAENVERHIQVLSVSRYLERIADHCTNIAEDVLYLVEGQIVRHEAPHRDSDSPADPA